MTHLCVAIAVQTPEQTLADISAAEQAGAGLVELRIDRLTDGDAVEAIVKQAAIPCIVTCRPTWEGGHSELDDQARAQLLQQAIDAGASYVDVELKSTALESIKQYLSRTPREKRTGLIVSSHDFTGRPARMENLVQALADSGADVIKIVWTARSIRDNLEVFEILQRRHKPTIALCMGEAGILSRILAKKFGAFLTFASLNETDGTAAGQISIKTLKSLYRWDIITPLTKVYGVVASPVAHSMSPAIHNAAFDADDYDGIYLPMLVQSSYESFKAFMESAIAMGTLNFCGASITIPHKQNALRWLESHNAPTEELARRIGTVNTIAIGYDSQNKAQLQGINTDYAAILDSITQKLGIERNNLKGYRAAVLGAGGTGRTAVAAFAHYGADVLVYNRTPERAEKLAEEFNGKTGSVRSVTLDELIQAECQIYLNTTSVGMYPHADESPFGTKLPDFNADTLVFDAVYNPIHTQLLKAAQARGARVISGVEMFVRQAARQFEMWTGHPAPQEVMRKVVEHRLAGN